MIAIVIIVAVFLVFLYIRRQAIGICNLMDKTVHGYFREYRR